MILQQALALLTDNNIQYILTTEPDKAAFTDRKVLCLAHIQANFG